MPSSLFSLWLRAADVIARYPTFSLGVCYSEDGYAMTLTLTPPPLETPKTEVLNVSDLTKSYHDPGQPALRELSLSVGAG